MLRKILKNQDYGVLLDYALNHSYKQIIWEAQKENFTDEELDHLEDMLTEVY